MSMILLALVLVLVFLSVRSGILWVAVYFVRAKAKGYGIPAVHLSVPFGIPRIIAAMTAFKNGNVFKRVTKLDEENPETRLAQVLFRWNLLSNNAENIKTVLSTNFKDYGLGHREHALGAAFGRGIFTLSGNGWKNSRHLLRPQFARDQISQLESVNQHARDLFRAIEVMQHEDHYVDAQFLFHQFTIDTATDFLFGESLNCLEAISGGDEVKVTCNGRTVTASEFVESYTFMVKHSVKRLIFGNLSWLTDSKEFREHIERARVVVDYYVQESYEKCKDTNEKKKYVFSHELARQGLNKIDIRDQIFNILIAGRDTTAVTLTFMVFYLAKNPKLYSKLRQIVLEEFGSKQENRPVTFEMLRGSKYLNAIINETLRLYPVVPMNQRTAIRDTVLPRGGGPDGQQPVFIPKGLSVSYHSIYVQRDKKIWGPDAYEFKPERWLKKMEIPAWTYIPFNGGPRICLGQQFALTELALMLVRIAQEYDEILPGSDLPDEPNVDVSLTIKSKTPVNVRFVKRDDGMN